MGYPSRLFISTVCNHWLSAIVDQSRMKIVRPVVFEVAALHVDPRRGGASNFEGAFIARCLDGERVVQF